MKKDLPEQLFLWSLGEEEVVADFHPSLSTVAFWAFANGEGVEVYLPLDEAIRLGEVLVKLKE